MVEEEDYIRRLNMWFIAEVVGKVCFPFGDVFNGKVLFNRCVEGFKVWLYPSNAMVVLPVEEAKRVLKTVRDKNNQPVAVEI